MHQLFLDIQMREKSLGHLKSENFRTSEYTVGHLIQFSNFMEGEMRLKD